MQALASRTAELGLPIGRPTLTKLESGTRQGISPAELLVLAAALEVAPVDLLIPVGHQAGFEILPRHVVDPWLALQWFDGELRVARESTAQGALTLLRAMGVTDETDVALVRRHDYFAQQWGRQFARLENFGDDPERVEFGRRMVREIQATYEEGLGIIRAEMTRREMLLPELPEGMDLGEQPEGG